MHRKIDDDGLGPPTVEQRMGLAADLDVPRFRPDRWWPGGDLQTLRNFLVRQRVDLSPWPAERIWIPVSEGDELAVSLHAPEGSDGRALVVFIHGLTGCEDSVYVRRSAREWLRRGYRVARLNLRGSAPSRPRCRGHYHAGRSEDLRDAMRGLLDRIPDEEAGIVAIGYSLGGNVLIKLLAEHGREFLIKAAATVCAPIDLAATSRCFLRRRNTIYHRWLLSRMKREAMTAPADLSETERKAIAGARTVLEFDDRFIAPRFGFDGASGYYAACSGQRFLSSVPVPLLAIHAGDDPWVPVAPYQRVRWSDNPNLAAILAAGGGHVGFHAGRKSDAVGNGGAPVWHDAAILTFAMRLL